MTAKFGIHDSTFMRTVDRGAIIIIQFNENKHTFEPFADFFSLLLFSKTVTNVLSQLSTTLYSAKKTRVQSVLMIVGAYDISKGK